MMEMLSVGPINIYGSSIGLTPFPERANFTLTTPASYATCLKEIQEQFSCLVCT
jgi:hypothetical protein